MSKYSLYTLIVALASSFVFISATPVRAQNTGSTTTQSPECNQVAWSCTEVTDLDAGLSGAPHRIRLTQSGLPPKDPSGNPTQFYVACGTETDNGYLATTGNSAIDERLCLGKDTLSKLQAEMGYKLTLINTQNPFTSTDGSIDITVKPQNDNDPRNHTCMLGWTMPVVVTGSQGTNDPNTNEASASTSSLKYTSFTFNSATAACMSVYSDPFGRVYNKDLKPVPGAKVSIFDFNSKALVNLFGIPNPVTTGSTGIFNFNLPAGSTYLQTSLTNTPLDVHPNYALAYTKPYVYGDVIVETGEKAEQRDIPVSGGNQPVLELTGYANVRIGNEIHIHGIASWPLTMVDVMQGTTSIANQQADKYGNFSFRLNPDSIDPTMQVTIKLTEVDLTVNPKVPAVNPATDSVTFDPIPSYLEGYAYNAQGKRVPFATVRIRMSQSDSIYYTTKADGEAFYSIAPRNLPILPYYIEIVSANVLPTKAELPTVTQSPLVTGTTMTPVITTATGGTPSKITIPTYAKQNKEYHSTQAVDIMAGTKNGKSVDPASVANASDAVFGSSKKDDGTARNVTKKDDARSPQNQAAAQRNYMTLLLAVALLIFIGSGAVVFMKKRAQTDPDMTSGGVYTKEESVDKPKDE